MFKDLIVHLDGTQEDEIRIAHAEAISLRFEAHLTGLYTNSLPEPVDVLGVQTGFAFVEPVIELEERLRREGDLAIARLKERWTRLAIPGELRRVETGARELPELCASEGRWADLFVATAPYRKDPASGWENMVETVLFEAGHGVYVVPPRCKPKDDIRSVLVAWRDTRESARAVAEALPFLRAAMSARIVVAHPQGESDDAEKARDIAAHLERHGAKVDVLAAVAADKTVAEVLLEEAHKMAADLIVMGAYGHSGFREWILGGTTREMIERSDVPILMAH